MENFGVFYVNRRPAHKYIHGLVDPNDHAFEYVDFDSHPIPHWDKNAASNYDATCVKHPRQDLHSNQYRNSFLHTDVHSHTHSISGTHCHSYSKQNIHCYALQYPNSHPIANCDSDIFTYANFGSQ